MNHIASLAIQGHAKEMDTPDHWVIPWGQNNVSDLHWSFLVLSAILKPASLTAKVTTSLCPLKYFISFT